MSGNLAPVLQVSKLTVRYGSIEAVRDISFHLGEGEILAMIGPNGAGKSSTVNAVLGLAPAAGAITLRGEPLDGTPADRMIRRGLSLVPEGRRVFAELSVMENLIAGGFTRTAAQRRQSIEMVVALFPALQSRLKQMAGTLSGGEQQMLAIGRALMGAPTVLLLDEPSLGLAPQIVDEIFELIARLRQQGVSILVVEQNAERAIALSDRTIVMVNGAIRREAGSKDFSFESYASTLQLGAVH
jgi:branched-chain amino acid transport system ATP-binding protein